MKRSTGLFRSQAVPRRAVLQAGSIGLLGFSMTDVLGWQAQSAAAETQAGATMTPPRKHRAVIFLFLTGGLSQHDSFDMKPAGPTEFKGEFHPIATSTPGIQICEHYAIAGSAERSLVFCCGR